MFLSAVYPARARPQVEAGRLRKVIGLDSRCCAAYSWEFRQLTTLAGGAFTCTALLPRAHANADAPFAKDDPFRREIRQNSRLRVPLSYQPEMSHGKGVMSAVWGRC